jgi:hypothetical protein
MKPEFSKQILKKYSNIVPHGWTERYEEANSWFLQFCWEESLVPVAQFYFCRFVTVVINFFTFFNTNTQSIYMMNIISKFNMAALCSR